MRKLALILTVVALSALPLLAGNGAPSGAHYNLNILGKTNCSPSDLTGSNRHTIQVLLNYSDATPTSPTALNSLVRTNKIFLQEGPFQVIDGNACDNNGATFQLPAPGCETATVEEVSSCDYDVYIRGLGKPTNSPYANITTCGISDNGTPADTADDYYQCSTETVTVTRTKGKSSFTRVTRELLTMCVDTFDDLNFDGNCDVRVQLFSDAYYQYFWDYDNHGLRLAQLRFYPNPE